MASFSKFSKITFIFVSLLVVIYAYFKLTAPQTLPIEKVKVVDPQQRVDRAELKQVVLPYVTKGFFGVNVGKIQEHVDQLPWVASSTVSRTWPNQVEIQITEKQPVARWGDSHLITNQAKIFTPEKATISSQLPVLYGPQGSQQEALAAYHQYQLLLSPLNLTITELRVSERHDISLQLNHQFNLYLGQENQLSRLQRFIEAYPKVLSGKLANLDSVNMQYSHGMAVHWRGE